MSRIGDPIQQLCPNGVPFKTLGEVITHLRTGLNPRKNFALNPPGAHNYYVTVRELGGLDVVFSEKTDRVDDAGLAAIDHRAQLKAGDVLFSATGTIGRTALLKTDPLNWGIKEGIYAITPDPQFLDSKFLIYLLGESSVAHQIVSRADGSIVVSVSMASLRQIKVPVPPLEVQREIVDTLDVFSALEAELKTELEARQRQHAFYWRTLLTPSAEWQTTTLGDIAQVFDGPHATPKKTDSGPWYLSISSLENGRFRLSASAHIGADQYNTWIRRVAPRVGDTMFSYETRIGQAAYWDRDEPSALGRRMGLLRPRESKVYPPFLTLAYLGPEFQSLIQAKTVHGGTVDRISIGDMPNWAISIPSLPEQQRIVGALDKFDALVNDRSMGLPAEIDARRQQYQYYRDRLLTFKELAA